MEQAQADLGAEIDALFKLPLSQFTAARNTLAARLNQAGRQADAAQVKALQKPPVSAWVVNQLYWRARLPFERLLASAHDLRRAQATRLSGKPAGMDEPLKAQRDALNELSRQASALLSEAGHNPNPDVLRRVTLDLQGLAARAGTDAVGATLGRLTADVDAPGFETLAALVPRSGAGGSRQGAAASTPPDSASRVLSFPGGPVRDSTTHAPTAAEREKARRAEAKAKRAAAQRVVAESERALATATRDAGKAEAAMKQAAAALKNAEHARDKAAAVLEKAAAQADAARLAARKAAAAAADAAQAAEDAERMLTRARTQLETLDD